MLAFQQTFSSTELVPSTDGNTNGFCGQPIFANDRAGPGTIKDGHVKWCWQVALMVCWEEGWGSACKFSDIDEGCGYPNACTDSHEIRQLSNENTYCFDWLFLYDWLETAVGTGEREDHTLPRSYNGSFFPLSQLVSVSGKGCDELQPQVPLWLIVRITHFALR